MYVLMQYNEGKHTYLYPENRDRRIPKIKKAISELVPVYCSSNYNDVIKYAEDNKLDSYTVFTVEPELDAGTRNILNNLNKIINQLRKDIHTDKDICENYRDTYFLGRVQAREEILNKLTKLVCYEEFKPR